MPDRTTVVFPPALKQRAIARSREQGISFGEFVRRAVESMLVSPVHLGTGQKTGDPFWDNLQAFNHGPTDLALHHDKYLYGRRR